MALLLPLAWLFISNFAISYSFCDDVYVEKVSIDSTQEDSIQIIFSLKNSSDRTYINKDLRIMAEKDGISGGLGFDYTLDYIDSNGSRVITVSPNWDKDEVDSVVICIKDEQNSNVWHSLNNFSVSDIGEMVSCVDWAIIFVASTAMIWRASAIRTSK